MKKYYWIFVVLALFPLGKWGVDGFKIFTTDKVLVETEIVDDFGDKTINREWKEKLNLGFDLAFPIAAVFLGIGFYLRKKAPDENSS